jgi:hypothetical protein
MNFGPALKSSSSCAMWSNDLNSLSCTFFLVQGLQTLQGLSEWKCMKSDPESSYFMLLLFYCGSFSPSLTCLLPLAPP